MALLCGAGFLRAVSSSLVWVYSTLVVQNKVLGEAGGNPWANPMFGRVFALEMSVFTAGKLGSFVLGGAGLGFFTCDAECAATMLSAISFGATVVWVRRKRMGRKRVGREWVDWQAAPAACRAAVALVGSL